MADLINFSCNILTENTEILELCPVKKLDSFERQRDQFQWVLHYLVCSIIKDNWVMGDILDKLSPEAEKKYILLEGLGRTIANTVQNHFYGKCFESYTPDLLRKGVDLNGDIIFYDHDFEESEFNTNQTPLSQPLLYEVKVTFGDLNKCFDRYREVVPEEVILLVFNNLGGIHPESSAHLSDIQQREVKNFLYRTSMKMTSSTITFCKETPMSKRIALKLPEDIPLHIKNKEIPVLDHEKLTKEFCNFNGQIKMGEFISKFKDFKMSNGEELVEKPGSKNEAKYNSLWMTGLYFDEPVGDTNEDIIKNILRKHGKIIYKTNETITECMLIHNYIFEKIKPDKLIKSKVFTKKDIEKKRKVDKEAAEKMEELSIPLTDYEKLIFSVGKKKYIQETLKREPAEIPYEFEIGTKDVPTWVEPMFRNLCHDDSPLIGNLEIPPEVYNVVDSNFKALNQEILDTMKDYNWYKNIDFFTNFMGNVNTSFNNHYEGVDFMLMNVVIERKRKVNGFFIKGPCHPMHGSQVSILVFQLVVRKQVDKMMEALQSKVSFFCENKESHVILAVYKMTILEYQLGGFCTANKIIGANCSFLSELLNILEGSEKIPSREVIKLPIFRNSSRVIGCLFFLMAITDRIESQGFLKELQRILFMISQSYTGEMVYVLGDPHKKVETDITQNWISLYLANMMNKYIFPVVNNKIDSERANKLNSYLIDACEYQSNEMKRGRIGFCKTLYTTKR